MNQEENFDNNLKNEEKPIELEDQNVLEDEQQEQQEDQQEQEFPTFQRAQLKSFFQDVQMRLLMSASFNKQFNKALSIFLFHLQFQLRNKKGPNKKINATDIIKMMTELNLGEMESILD